MRQHRRFAMITNITGMIALVASAALVAPLAAAEPASAPESPTVITASDFVLENLAGGELPLAAWAGRPVLIVNTASRCGHTKQYAALQDLATRYAERGLIVLGVPSNDFGRQEPGTAEEIIAFCQRRFGVSFPLAAKAVVKPGPKQHPLYAWLTSQSDTERGVKPGPVRWNFEKFLLNGDGVIVGRYRSKVKPDDAKIINAIEAALAAGT